MTYNQQFIEKINKLKEIGESFKTIAKNINMPYHIMINIRQGHTKASKLALDKLNEYYPEIKNYPSSSSEEVVSELEQEIQRLKKENEKLEESVDFYRGLLKNVTAIKAEKSKSKDA